MSQVTRKVVIVGGGTAGWITANVVAAECREWTPPLEVVLVESPDIPTIGVGEGTWPSMRRTLQRIGVPEDEFVRRCNASFKQGTRFFGWSSGSDDYLHPFSLPTEYADLNPARYWLAEGGDASFAALSTPQAAAIEHGLAPKQAAMPEYAFAFNYGYHLDASKFAELLRDHAVARLDVQRIEANVRGIESAQNGDIAALVLDRSPRLTGDLFVDCTGQRALLIGDHCGARFRSVKDALFNDRAIAAQVPYGKADAAIASTTLATANAAGWIWDIGLQTRRGVGHVFASSQTDEAAAFGVLQEYIRATSPGIDPDALELRTIAFEPGYRENFWSRNCVAIGLSAGFVEPLEASALALIEQTAVMLAEQLPRDRQVMDVVARRCNERLRYHWDRIVEFLKLHYAIGARSEPYWRAHRAEGSWPDSLKDKLALWQQQPPWHDDAPRVDELFPSASYQYVLYGMGFRPRYRGADGASYRALRRRADQVFNANRAKAAQACRQLPRNRELLATIAARAERDANGG